ncbi:MAG TPA: phage terminase large subunit [Acetobacteraceae bacterium]|jgi:predicted phage terminase large subunit-like protein|nr:phage terminase large subunit [Acetobacteraceae bacterium]
MSERARRPSLLEWARHALAPLDMKPAAHHQLLLGALGRVAEGEVDRLMVLMPPGAAKSTYGSVLFPAWWFMRHPRSSVIAACHTAGLATYFGQRARATIAENGDVLGYALAQGSRAADRWRTDGGGEYFAAGVRGPLTGRRADLVIIDDPVKGFADADSPGQREHVWNWYRADLTTRLKPRGRIVLIMTRWHADDLGGRLLESGDSWEVLKLPALSPEGVPLWPAHQDAAALERVRANVGARVWSALYQQEPRPDEGALFPVERIAVVGAEAAAGARAVRAWDLAATAAVSGRDPDWTVGLKLAREGGGRCVVQDVVRLRGGPHEVEEVIVRTAAADGRDVTVALPQDPGQAGKQQVAWLAARLAGYRITASPETGSKVTRASVVASQAEAGNLAVAAAAWNRAFIEELRDFPHGRKDDQVDALSRAFGVLIEAGLPARRAYVGLMGR